MTLPVGVDRQSARPIERGGRAHGDLLPYGDASAKTLCPLSCGKRQPCPETFATVFWPCHASLFGPDAQDHIITSVKMRLLKVLKRRDFLLASISVDYIRPIGGV